MVVIPHAVFRMFWELSEVIPYSLVSIFAVKKNGHSSRLDVLWGGVEWYPPPNPPREGVVPAPPPTEFQGWSCPDATRLCVQGCALLFDKAKKSMGNCVHS